MFCFLDLTIPSTTGWFASSWSPGSQVCSRSVRGLFFSNKNLWTSVTTDARPSVRTWCRWTLFQTIWYACVPWLDRGSRTNGIDDSHRTCLRRQWRWKTWTGATCLLLGRWTFLPTRSIARVCVPLSTNKTRMPGTRWRSGKLFTRRRVCSAEQRTARRHRFGRGSDGGIFQVVLDEKVEVETMGKRVREGHPGGGSRSRDIV